MAIEIPGRGPLGRPSLLTPERAERILELIRQGHYISTACRANDISYEALVDWRERAAKGEEPYLQFIQRFEKADSEGELAVWGTVLAGTKLPSTAGVIAASIAAERKWPERYGRRDRLDIEHHSVREIHVEVSFKPPPLVVDGPGTPQAVVDGLVPSVVEGEVRELGPGEST